MIWYSGMCCDRAVWSQRLWVMHRMSWPGLTFGTQSYLSIKGRVHSEMVFSAAFAVDGGSTSTPLEFGL